MSVLFFILCTIGTFLAPTSFSAGCWGIAAGLWLSDALTGLIGNIFKEGR